MRFLSPEARILAVLLAAGAFLGSPGGDAWAQSTTGRARIVSIRIEPASVRLAPRAEIALKAVGVDSRGGTRDLTRSAAWRSSDPRVVRVGVRQRPKGSLRAYAPGRATVTAKWGRLSASVLVVVAPPSSPPPSGSTGGSPTRSTIATLSVREDSGFSRVLEPVTAGIPIPRSLGLTDPLRLGLVAGGNEIPSQFTVLSRWGGVASDASLPIRWVLVDCQLSLLAGETATLELVDMGPRSSRPLPDSPITVSDQDPRRLLLESGSFRVSIDRERGTLFEEIVMDGRTVVRDGAPELPDSGVSLALPGGRVYRTVGAVPTAQVEVSGPMRVVVRLEQELVDASGASLQGGRVRVVHRVTLFSGKNELAVETALENRGGYGGFGGSPDKSEWLFFDSARLDIPIVLGDPREFATEGHRASASASTRWRVLQEHRLAEPEDESRNFVHRVSADGRQVATGARHPGWIALSDGSSTVEAGIKWFWQTYEKGLSAGESVLSYELWPSEGSHPEGAGSYQLEGGRHSVVFTRLRFGAGGLDPERARLGQEAFLRPLLLRAPGAYYAQSGGISAMDSGALAYSGTSDDARMNRAYARYNQMLRILAGAAAPDPGVGTSVVSLVDARENRYEALGTTADWYGWPHFGDQAWGGGYDSGHYDMAGFFFLHHLRLGDRALFDRAEEGAVYMASFGQYHYVDPNAYEPPASFYEKTSHGTNPDGDYFRPRPSHDWIRRLVYHYWLTGSRRSYDAALENAEGLLRFFSIPGANDIFTPGGLDHSFAVYEPRFSGWTLDNALVIHEMTGDPRWMRFAEALYANGLRYVYNLVGHFEGDGPRNPGWLLMTGYVIEPIVRLYLATEDVALRNDILDLARSVVANQLEADVVAEAGAGASYAPIAFPDDWSDSNPGPESLNTLYNGFFASAYALVGWKDQNRAYLERAHRIFADGVYFHEYLSGVPGHDPVDETMPFPFSWQMGTYPGSESKVIARFVRSGQPYLFIVGEVQAGR